MAGMFYWTFMEYALHRFLLHGEDTWMRFIPFNNYVAYLHFLTHGIHHAFPQDRYRLVMPPVLGYFIAYFFIYKPLGLFLSAAYIYNFMAGVIWCYLIYDEMHYFMHHSDP